MHKHITLKDTAKIIRVQLKERLSLTKFSVKIKEIKSTGKREIHISWSDGYTEKEVMEVCDRFRRHLKPGGGTDLDMWEGEETQWMVDSIFYRRQVDFNSGLGERVRDAFEDHALELFNSYVPEMMYWWKVRQTESITEIDAAGNLVQTGYPSPKTLFNLDLVTKKYLNQIIANISEHEDWENRQHSLVLETHKLKARFNTKGSEFEWLEQDKIIYFDLCSSTSPLSECIKYKWVIYDLYFSEDAYTIEEEELEIEGSFLKGNVAEYVRSNGLEHESLESILEKFYRETSKENILVSEDGDRLELVRNKENNTLQFLFHTEPTSYIIAKMKNTGFLGKGRIYQKEDDRHCLWFAETILEALGINLKGYEIKDIVQV